MGPRFSGKVRKKFQRRERKWGGNYETTTSAIRKPRTSEPVMEAVKKIHDEETESDLAFATSVSRPAQCQIIGLLIA